MAFGIATARGLKVSDLRGPSRVARITTARHEAMWLIREATDLSYPDIGRMFGGRDHTTVINAYRKIQALVDLDPSYGDDLRRAATATQGGLELQRLQQRAAALQAQATSLQRRIDAATQAVVAERGRAA
jgi:hypothetical protein